jgi:peptidoglycan/xylan/chitin deacetylase (PgdA/CDA1 family)
MIRSAIRALSPPGRKARLSVLIFHRVLPEPDPLFPGEVDRQRFDSICQWLRQWFNVLPLDQALSRLAEGSLPDRAAAITFDDGYADNCEIALPILQRHGLAATFFVASGFLDGGCMWNDVLIESVRRSTRAGIDTAGLPCESLGRLGFASIAERRQAIDALVGAVKYMAPAERAEVVAQVASRCGAAVPTDLMMTTEQLRRLRAGGMLIGAHTATHPILARLPASEARHEIRSGRQALESMLDERIGLFAYPNGKPGRDYSPETVEIVRGEGFDAAVSTAWGAAAQDSSLLEIPRFTPWDRNRWKFGLRLARNLAARPTPASVSA